MFGDSDERTPLLQEQFPGQFTIPNVNESRDEADLSNAYKQFCFLVGNNPTDQPSSSGYSPPSDTLYHRALQHRRKQATIYALTRALTNTLLLAQVVLGAALTGLGAADSPGWLITVFGAANTVIAGLVAFLKSRGQPMRARMFRDDLDRVVDEIENSATMWKGISQRVHGYDAIDTDEAVTVRSEVARLTRLFDRAVKTNTMNDPDHYGSGISMDNATRGLRSRSNQPLQPFQPQVPSLAPAAPVAFPGPSVDPDESPATQLPVPSQSKDVEPVKDITPAPAEKSNPPSIPAEGMPSVPAASPTGPEVSEPQAVAPPLLGDPDLELSPATSAIIPGARKESKDLSKSDLATNGEQKSS